MFWSRKAAAVAEAPVNAREPEDTRPQMQRVEPAGEAQEVERYVALCKQIGAETPAVRMFQLRQFLAERGMPEYDRHQVHAYLSCKAREREKQGGGYCVYQWYPLREEDKIESFLWFWGGREM